MRSLSLVCSEDVAADDVVCDAVAESLYEGGRYRLSSRLEPSTEIDDMAMAALAKIGCRYIPKPDITP
jgi:hypothetical protein